MSQLKIEAATGQYLGERKEQQDRAAIFGSPKAPGYLMAVLADGMGGLTGGSLAAEQVIRTAQQNFEQFSPEADDIEKLLNVIAHEAHTIINLSAMSAEKQPHSTMVILVLTPERIAYWAHVGDSRLYYFKNGRFAGRTVDHSVAEKLIASKRMSREEALNHKHANLLVNVLGTTTSELFVTVQRYEGYKAGDAFLLCSDGLWQYFANDELTNYACHYPPRQAAEMLIAEVTKRGRGTNADNCTLVIVKVSEQPSNRIKR